MLGEGISLIDLTRLLQAIRNKDLELQVKILDGPWEKLRANQVQAMIVAVTRGDVKNGADIRLRLFAKAT